MSEQIDLWRLVEAAGLQFQRHEQASRGWLWALPGMDWSGPYDTKEEALTHALRWLVEHAREEHATELAAGEWLHEHDSLHAQFHAAHDSGNLRGNAATGRRSERDRSQRSVSGVPVTGAQRRTAVSPVQGACVATVEPMCRTVEYSRERACASVDDHHRSGVSGERPPRPG
jgi:hypothetical protein